MHLHFSQARCITAFLNVFICKAASFNTFLQERGPCNLAEKTVTIASLSSPERVPFTFLRGDLDTATTRQFLEQFPFLKREAHWQDHFDTSKEITTILTTQMRHTLARQTEHTTILGLGRNAQHELAPIRKGNRHFAAQHSLHQVYIDVDVEIIALALIHAIGFDTDY